MEIELINDQPEYSGTGVYAWHLYHALNGQLPVRMTYYDFRTRSCRLLQPGREEQRFSISTWPQPLFWWDCHRRIKHGAISHFVSQNLSFLKVSGKSIITCLDLIPLIMPQSPGEAIWRRLLYSGIRRADHIISISEHTKKDLMRIYRIPPERITVTYLGVAPEFHPRDKKKCRRQLGLPLEAGIVLHVGTAARRKNFTAVCRAYAMVRRSINGLRLVKVGPMGKSDAALAAALDLGDGLIIRDRVSSGELPLYYSAADIFVFPSLYEGFGLPALEAMASGCPVVCSNTTSLPEVVDGAGLLHDPSDIQGIADSILRILENEEGHRSLSEKGIKHSAKFTWEKTARETAGIYWRVAG